MKELTRNYEDNQSIKVKILEFIDNLEVSETEKNYLKSVNSENDNYRRLFSLNIIN